MATHSRRGSEFEFVLFMADRQKHTDIVFLASVCASVVLSSPFLLESAEAPFGTACGASLFAASVYFVWNNYKKAVLQYREFSLITAKAVKGALLAARLVQRQPITTFQLTLFHAFAIPSALGWQVCG